MKTINDLLKEIPKHEVLPDNISKKELIIQCNLGELKMLSHYVDIYTNDWTAENNVDFQFGMREKALGQIEIILITEVDCNFPSYLRFTKDQIITLESEHFAPSQMAVLHSEHNEVYLKPLPN